METSVAVARERSDSIMGRERWWTWLAGQSEEDTVSSTYPGVGQPTDVWFMSQGHPRRPVISV